MDTLPPKPASSISVPREPRRIRRHREREHSHPDPPSLAPSGKGKAKDKATPTGPRARAKAGESAAPRPARPDGDDFIPFADPSSSSEGEKRTETRERGGGERKRSPPVRDWDRGKVKGSSPSDRRKGRERSWERDSRETNGRKRKYDTLDDGYENKKQRTDAASRKAPWVSDVDWEGCNNVAEMLHCEVEAFVKYISPTPVEDEVRGLVVKLIAKAVTAAFPDAQLLPFGSFETKLYLPLGDIDLVILSDSMAYSNKLNVLHALANTIKRAQLADKVTIIAKAKVPIVKFISTHGRFNVDISINQSNGIAAGRVINGFLEHLQSTALRSLVMITKTFLSQRSMNEVYTGGLGSYSIVCLAVSFLQMHPKIRRGEIDAEKNLGVLVMEFFELYGCYFNYEGVGISVRDGGTYFNKRERGWVDYSRNHLLSIEDPVDPSNDISRGTFAIMKVRATFAGAHGILTAAAYLRAGIITARREGRSSNLRGHYSQEDMSILSSVLGVTQETINHRKLVQEVYDKRTLHQMLGVSAKETIATSISVPHTQNAKTSKRAAESVESAWEQADDPESNDGLSRRHRNKRDTKRQEEGRYDIRRQQPPNKRRKTKQDEIHAVFTTDDEEDGVDMPITEYVRGDSLDVDEEGEYEEYDLEEGDRAVNGETAEQRRRSYWLSKAIAIGNGDDSD